MKKKLILLLLLGICIPAIAFSQEAKDSVKVKVTKIITDLAVGQQFLSDQIKVEFLKVILDSRCPRKVICIWAGEAKVLLGINFNGAYFEKEVTVSGGGTALALSGDLQLQVSGLRPYPETGTGIPQEEYCLEVATVFAVKN